MGEEILENQEVQAPFGEENAEFGSENATTGGENTDRDYEALIEEDLIALRATIPELSEIRDITELENPVRYGALRDLGLSPEEAYRATTTAKPRRYDNRAHLRSSAPKALRTSSSDMSYRELEMARELFSGVSDAEIQRLYKKVTK